MAMGPVANAAKNGIGEVAKAVSETGVFQDIKKGANGAITKFAESKVGQRFVNDVVKPPFNGTIARETNERLGQTVNKIATDPGLVTDKVDALIRNVNDASKDLGEQLSRLANKGLDDKSRSYNYNTVKSIFDLLEKNKQSVDLSNVNINHYKEVISGAFKDTAPVDVYSTLGPVDKAFSNVKTYFTTPDKQVRTTRILTAVGAYETMAIGNRVLNGGSITRDQYGQKDLAGVPFI